MQETIYILNLGDEYLGLCPEYGFWRDIHLMLEGNAVDHLQLRFMIDWMFASKNKQINFEVNAFIYDHEILRQLERSFIKDLESCSEITMESYMKRPLTVKFKESVSRLLSPLL